MKPPSTRTSRRPANSLDRLPGSVEPRRSRAARPASCSTSARLRMPTPAARTRPYHPGGTTKPVFSSERISNCSIGSLVSNGSARSNAVMNTSRHSRSTRSVESRIPASSLTKLMAGGAARGTYRHARSRLARGVALATGEPFEKRLPSVADEARTEFGERRATAPQSGDFEKLGGAREERRGGGRIHYLRRFDLPSFSELVFGATRPLRHASHREPPRCEKWPRFRVY